MNIGTILSPKLTVSKMTTLIIHNDRWKMPGCVTVTLFLTYLDLTFLGFSDECV